MGMIEIKSDPTLRDRVIFAALWLGFWVFVGAVAPRATGGVLLAAAVTGACFLLSITLNRDYAKKSQMAGAIPPALLAALGFCSGFLDPSSISDSAFRGFVLGAFGAVGIAGTVMSLASRRAGSALYRTWMFAVLPIGWTVSHILLGVVFFVILTPIGLAMRALGRDPTHRRLDRSRATYWTVRKQTAGVARYFRQF